ncbi:MAG: tryptophan--tRNA ligase [bacterium]|nr:tryptophan--tRNA ligase [Mycoplasmatota bacterium]MDD6757681.1 tryptophan--tRNA ligase [bacterium]MDY2908301.1 tryptophan--tRNA ligase [Candidatus Faecimonas sp.]
MKKTILTGLRPTGNLHLGHLFGAGQNYIKLQDDYNFYLEIADVQALTDNFNNPEKVRKNVTEITIDLLSIGLDPEKVNFFIQSKIPEIAELTVFYSNLVTVARLERNPTVKTEIAQKKELFGNDGESITYGFLGYPVSQAADITAFDGEVVPVGEDQLPLLEQCREIVRKFNSIYGETLKEPKAILSETKRVKGLDGNEKMGKSLGNAIFLNDNDETIKKKVMSAITDPAKIKKDDKANPDICMVYYYHKLVNKKENNEKICTECKKGARGCVQCKKELIEAMNEFLNPIRQKRKYYEDHPEIVKEILDNGTKKAKQRAEEQLKKVKKSMKIDY